MGSKNIAKSAARTGRESLAYDVVYISDTHLGKETANTYRLLSFLHNMQCKEMVIAGDFIDTWILQTGEDKNFREIDKRVFDCLLYKISQGMKLTVLGGNHDDRIRRFLWLLNRGMRCKYQEGEERYKPRDLEFETCEKSFPFSLTDKMNVEAFGGTIFLEHGDDHDPVELLKGGESYNKARDLEGIYDAILEAGRGKIAKAIRKRGIPFTIPLRILAQSDPKIRKAIRKTERKALAGEFDGVMRGHWHRPGIKTKKIRNKKTGKVERLFRHIDIGDWVEHNHYAVKDANGEIRVLDWVDEALKAGIPFEEIEGSDLLNRHEEMRPMTEELLEKIERFTWKMGRMFPKSTAHIHRHQISQG